MAKTAAKKAPSKSEILNNIAESTGLARKDVNAVLEGLTGEISKALGKKGPGMFAIPGLCKIQVRKTAAKPKRKGRNPATGEEIWLAPKPAAKKVVVRPLKALKEMI